MTPPQEPPHTQHTRIVVDVKVRAVTDAFGTEGGLEMLGAIAHRAELVAGERTATEGLPGVREDERSPVLEPDRQHDQGQERRREEQGDDAEDDVEQPLAGP